MSETGNDPASDKKAPALHGGGCHCGAVRFEVETDLGQILACNCSICSKKGLLLTFVPDAAFRLGSGAQALREYRFNKHVIGHMFCSDCGVEPFARGAMPDGTAMVAVNVRCLDGIDLGTLSPTPYDGRNA
ncbi:GFA family protein [Ancylobacter sp. 6x-1]|uniref:GFA family protein n=1 Tax=Ancylobacter crimeensis TaxID=2579147 RepID=A0ABT0D697_9HYPH|nr:GFA family protein [Ancylobacter crimeensis]MCK0195459.1 GFA family protein [Ancylobacter crimeensis]